MTAVPSDTIRVWIPVDALASFGPATKERGYEIVPASTTPFDILKSIEALLQRACLLIPVTEDGSLDWASQSTGPVRSRARVRSSRVGHWKVIFDHGALLNRPPSTRGRTAGRSDVPEEDDDDDGEEPQRKRPRLSDADLSDAYDYLNKKGWEVKAVPSGEVSLRERILVLKKRLDTKMRDIWDKDTVGTKATRERLEKALEEGDVNGMLDALTLSKNFVFTQACKETAEALIARLYHIWTKVRNKSGAKALYVDVNPTQGWMQRIDGTYRLLDLHYDKDGSRVLHMINPSSLPRDHPFLHRLPAQHPLRPIAAPGGVQEFEHVATGEERRQLASTVGELTALVGSASPLPTGAAPRAVAREPLGLLPGETLIENAGGGDCLFLSYAYLVHGVRGSNEQCEAHALRIRWTCAEMNYRVGAQTLAAAQKAATPKTYVWTEVLDRFMRLDNIFIRTVNIDTGAEHSVGVGDECAGKLAFSGDVENGHWRVVAPAGGLPPALRGDPATWPAMLSSPPTWTAITRPAVIDRMEVQTHGLPAHPLGKQRALRALEVEPEPVSGPRFEEAAASVERTLANRAAPRLDGASAEQEHVDLGDEDEFAEENVVEQAEEAYSPTPPKKAARRKPAPKGKAAKKPAEEEEEAVAEEANTPSPKKKPRKPRKK